MQFVHCNKKRRYVKLSYKFLTIILLKTETNMSKLLALDIGDEWTGIAITDTLQMLARPCTTVKTSELAVQLANLILKEKIEEIIIGYPITMKGTESAQTQKVIVQKNKLEEFFPKIQFTFWDERLSSKRAESISKPGYYKDKQEKLKEHAKAAAFILDSYLNYLKNKIDDTLQT